MIELLYYITLHFCFDADLNIYLQILKTVTIGVLLAY